MQAQSLAKPVVYLFHVFRKGLDAGLYAAYRYSPAQANNLGQAFYMLG